MIIFQKDGNIKIPNGWGVGGGGGRRRTQGGYACSDKYEGLHVYWGGGICLIVCHKNVNC